VEGSMILDIVVVAFLCFFAIKGYLKGFLETAFHFVPVLAALAGVYLLSPSVGRFFRETPFYGWLQTSIGKGLHLESLFANQGTQMQGELLGAMKLPVFLQSALVENNNPVAYKILGVERIQDYVEGYLANISMNIIGAVVIFLIVFVAVKLFLGALNLVSHLPGLNFLNHFFGFLLGSLQGITFFWVFGIVMTLFSCNGKFSSFLPLMEKSWITSILYQNNILLVFLLKIFTG